MFVQPAVALGLALAGMAGQEIGAQLQFDGRAQKLFGIIR